MTYNFQVSSRLTIIISRKRNLPIMYFEKVKMLLMELFTSGYNCYFVLAKII